MRKFWAWFWNKRNNDWGCIGCEFVLFGSFAAFGLMLLLIKICMWLENYL